MKNDIIKLRNDIQSDIAKIRNLIQSNTIKLKGGVQLELPSFSMEFLSVYLEEKYPNIPFAKRVEIYCKAIDTCEREHRPTIRFIKCIENADKLCNKYFEENYNYAKNKN